MRLATINYYTITSLFLISSVSSTMPHATHVSLLQSEPCTLHVKRKLHFFKLGTDKLSFYRHRTLLEYCYSYSYYARSGVLSQINLMLSSIDS